MLRNMSHAGHAQSESMRVCLLCHGRAAGGFGSGPFETISLWQYDECPPHHIVLVLVSVFRNTLPLLRDVEALETQGP